MELTNPFTRQIASSWSKVFEADLFASFEKATVEAVDKLLTDIEASAALGLKERAKGQGELCLEEARIALRKTLDVVRDTMNTEQKEISRCFAPHVQNQLIEGYDSAMMERGAGSVARQKVFLTLIREASRCLIKVVFGMVQALFHNYVDDIKEEVFNDGAEVLLGRLSTAAEAVGKALEDSLEELAEKVRPCLCVRGECLETDDLCLSQIEVSIAVLWEGPRDDPSQVKAREMVVATITEILSQVEFWQQSEQHKRTAAATSA